MSAYARTSERMSCWDDFHQLVGLLPDANQPLPTGAYLLLLGNILDSPLVARDCFTRHEPVIVPARTLLSQLP